MQVAVVAKAARFDNNWLHASAAIVAHDHAYLGVQGRQRVIKQIDISVCVDSASHGDTLLLTPTDVHASLSKLSLVTTWNVINQYRIVGQEAPTANSQMYSNRTEISLVQNKCQLPCRKG